MSDASAAAREHRYGDDRGAMQITRPVDACHHDERQADKCRSTPRG